MLLIEWFQVMSLLASINVDWPQSIATFFQVARLFAFEVDVISPICILPDWGFEQNLGVQLGLPLAFALMYTFYKLVRWLKKEEKESRCAARARPCSAARPRGSN